MPQLLSIKQIVSDASMEIGIAQKPVATVVNSADQDIVQMMALMTAVADEVLREEPYKSILGDKVWVADKEGTPKLRPTTDDDIILFDGRLMVLGLKFRFLKAKGLEFGEEMRDFSIELNHQAANSNARVLDLDTDEGRQI